MNSEPRLTREQIDRARGVSIFDVLGVPKERDYFACCPIHQGDNPKAFHVYTTTGENGQPVTLWHCFTGCGCGGDVIDLVRKQQHMSFADAVEWLNGEYEPMAYEPIEETPKEWVRPDWSIHSTRHVSRWVNHPDKYALWMDYKPISRATIDAYKLGVGVVPQQRLCLHDRLLIPVFENGIMVSVRGRRIACDCEQKWLTAGGHKNTVYNLENIRKGGVVWITGNNIDALMLMERHPQYDAISPLTGEGTRFRREWIDALKDTEQVIVAYDNDAAGLKASVKLCNLLLEAGIKARRWEWDKDAPPKADIGWLLMQEVESAA